MSEALPSVELSTAPANADTAASGQHQAGAFEPGDAGSGGGTVTTTRSETEVPEHPVGRLRFVLAVFALFGVGVALPMLTLYGENSVMFIAARTSGWQVLEFALITTLAPTVLVVGLAWLVGRIAPTRLARGGAIAVAAATVGAYAARQLIAERTVLGAMLVVATAAGLAWAYDRSPFARTMLRNLAVLPVFLLLQFLFMSESGPLMWADPDPEAASVSVANDGPVVVVVFDELPLATLLTDPDTINAELFPNLAGLAETSHWFPQAMSNATATTKSVPTILNGSLTRWGGADTNRDRNLFTLLADEYEIHAVESVARLCQKDHCVHLSATPATKADFYSDVGVVLGQTLGLPPIRDRLPSIDNAWGDFYGRRQSVERTDAILEVLSDYPMTVRHPSWTNELAAGAVAASGLGDREMLYIHSVTPHNPWVTVPSGHRYASARGLYGPVNRNNGELSVDELRLNLQRHMWQVGFVDSMLGQILDGLRSTGSFDDATIILTADHGFSLTDGPRRGASEDNVDQQYRVPLLIKEPGQSEAVVNPSSAFGYDIVPTLVDVLGVEFIGDEAWEFDGQSLLDPDLPAMRDHEIVRVPDFWDGSVTSGPVGLASTVEVHERLLPDRSTWLAVAAGEAAAYVGPNPEPVAPVAAPGLALRWKVTQQPSIGNYNELLGVTPSLIDGILSVDPDDLGVIDGSAEVLHDVLFLLDGEVAGSGWLEPSSVEDGQYAIRGVIDPHQLENGRNQLGVLVWSPSQERWMRGRGSGIPTRMLTEQRFDADAAAAEVAELPEVLAFSSEPSEVRADVDAAVLPGAGGIAINLSLAQNADAPKPSEVSLVADNQEVARWTVPENGPPLVTVGERSFINLNFKATDEPMTVALDELDPESQWLMLSYPDGVLAIPLEQG